MIVLISVSHNVLCQTDVIMPATDTAVFDIYPYVDYTVYDAGGTANYPHSAHGVLILTSTSGMPIHMEGDFDIQKTYDKLYVYDGPDDTYPLIGTYTGTGTLDITGTRDTLCLLFTSNGSTARPGFAFKACAPDSIGPEISNLMVTAITGETANISWTDRNDSSSRWMLYYGTSPYNLNKSVQVESPHATLRGLQPLKSYYFRVYNNAGQLLSTGVCGAELGAFTTVCASNAATCVNYTDLTSCHVSCYYGSYGNPQAYRGVIDYGSGSISSRHTVHYNTNEYDPRTGASNATRLKVVPDGEIASVRLGNWNNGGQGECVIYE
ncbi:MAG: hypothetical protein KBT04_00505 [Bacteroidales bacterium]|nr:hypothetical protein [Candidatus Colimorpha onthohippi]